MSTAELIANGYRMARQFLHRMCADLTDEQFQYQPIAGANSAAWIVGHLALSAIRTAERVGATGVPEASEEFVQNHKATRQPAGSQSGMGAKAELLALLDDSVEKLMEALRLLPQEFLEQPPPTTAPPIVTNQGEMLLFGVMHFGLHFGQLSTIRRSLGKPPLV